MSSIFIHHNIIFYCDLITRFILIKYPSLFARITMRIVVIYNKRYTDFQVLSSTLFYLLRGSYLNNKY